MNLGDTKRKGRPGKQRFSAAPKKGARKRTGVNFGGTFNLTAKKPEPDQPPRTLGAMRGGAGRTNSRAARLKRLEGKLI